MSEVGLKPRAEIRSHQGRKEGQEETLERRGPSTQSPRAGKHTPHRKGESEISYILRKAGLWEAGGQTKWGASPQCVKAGVSLDPYSGPRGIAFDRRRDGCGQNGHLQGALQEGHGFPAIRSC